MSYLPVAVTAAVVAVASAGFTAGCSALTGGPCTDGRQGSANQQLDYIDFIRIAGVTYMAEPMFGYRTSHAHADHARPVATIKCELSVVSVNPGKPSRDLDAAFVPAGTQVWAQSGVASRCAVVAARDGHDVLYVAAQQTSPKVEPLCTTADLALPSPTPRD